MYAYSAYGEVAVLGPDGGNSLQYTGRENDGTGLYYYRARTLDPITKRFTSEDPIGIAGGINLYSYVGGNPISYTDPTGENPALLIPLGIAAVYYGGMSLASSIYNFYAAQSTAQSAQQVLNANISACNNYPQGGSCNSLGANRAFVLQCTANTVGSGANLPGTLGNPIFPSLGGGNSSPVPPTPPKSNDPRYPIFPSNSGQPIYAPGYNR